MKRQLTHTYEDIISLENLCDAWKEFIRGKRSKQDVQEYQLNLSDNIISLHTHLQQKAYKHGTYHQFRINDPKPRLIHKAAVQDRLLHHAIHRKLYPFFDKTFISDSYASRTAKGTHRAIQKYKSFAYKVSKNHTQTAWVLQCDIQKFFATIDQEMLKEELETYIVDKDLLQLLHSIVQSFNILAIPGKGLPLGNLTSQLFANVYMNKLDQWIKHKLKAKYYIRYADDMTLVHNDKKWLIQVHEQIQGFLEQNLKLFLHPQKTKLATVASGVDILGWVQFPEHSVLRTKTKNRMLKKIRKANKDQVLQSYLGMLSHGNAYKVKEQVLSHVKYIEKNIHDFQNTCLRNA